MQLFTYLLLLLLLRLAPLFLLFPPVRNVCPVVLAVQVLLTSPVLRVRHVALSVLRSALSSVVV